MAVRALVTPKSMALSGVDALVVCDVVYQSTAGELPDNVQFVQDFAIFVDVEKTSQDQVIQIATAVRAHATATWSATINNNQVSVVQLTKA